ncbi:class I SAM-dependent methyltransferase [Alloacidobacterium sp.]|uniref:class I SAM-dependent methyltransferase n=1 Tax=Alloacidobacterium sp. TaxID=2951999 RepID=UPI002D30921C|nr:class I SAM-dependent methyltransferase [Alloacidobacterium sp.]HYK36556.1 class I SAM-dependent methyltransferase [Alloacidobacterium sp.]
MRSASVRFALASLFHAIQTCLGVSVTPSHFYFPVPSFKSFHNKNWTACRPLTAVDLRLQDQIDHLHTDILPYADEWTFSETGDDDQHFHFNNGFFERIDAEIAYSFVRHHSPKRVIEIGSGNTTLVLAAALERNASTGYPSQLISVEPHPPSFLKNGLPGLSQLIEAPVQRIPIDLFRTLAAGDILFIDSSHVVSIDSDVLYECLRILLELASGVLVHFHDVFTPLDYPKKFVMENLCFWGEQYLLEAFLCFNSAFRVIWSSSAMQQFHADVLRRVFPAWEGSFTRMPAALKIFAPTLDGKNVWPCSFWITRS